MASGPYGRHILHVLSLAAEVWKVDHVYAIIQNQLMVVKVVKVKVMKHHIVIPVPVRWVVSGHVGLPGQNARWLVAQERKPERVFVNIQNIGMVVFIVLDKETIQKIVTRPSARWMVSGLDGHHIQTVLWLAERVYNLQQGLAIIQLPHTVVNNVQEVLFITKRALQVEPVL